MCREIALACGATPAGSYPMLVRRLQERFEAVAHNEARRPVLLLDESQDLRPDVLGMLRLLTNFDMDSRLVLSVILAGTTALRTLLARDDQEAIARRIIYYAQLRLLSRDEIAGYVAPIAAPSPAPPPSPSTSAPSTRSSRSAAATCAPPTISRSSRWSTLPPPGLATVSVQHVVAAPQGHPAVSDDDRRAEQELPRRPGR